MDPVDIARWQFGITTVYHFLMVPLTIGLGLVVAVLQTAYTRTRDERYQAMTTFWSRIFLINFVMGVVTGLVQEFQFGLAWSQYSRFVGDVFGAPLAMEALFAFFLESTFLGLWMFGEGRLSLRLRTACLWVAVLGSTVSAYFILCANSWMQHPVGAHLVNGRPRLTDIGAVLTNNTAILAFAHTMTGSLAVAGSLLVGISWHHLRKQKIAERAGAAEDPSKVAWRRSLRLGGWISVVFFAGLALSGDAQGKLMFQQQPMKMAASEALCHTEQPASFSIFAVGDVSKPDCETVKSLNVPYLLSFLAKGDLHSKVTGVEELQPIYRQRYGAHYPDSPELGARAGKPVNYSPVLPITYWGFRLMIGFGAAAAAYSALALWLTRRGRMPTSRWLSTLAVLGILAPFAANSAGWIFTEMGRQPFVVAPNPTGNHDLFFYTAQAVSPGVSSGELLGSVITLTAVYGVLAVVEVMLILRAVRGGMPAPGAQEQDRPDEPDGSGGASEEDDVLAFAYEGRSS